MSAERQAQEVRKVKKYESGVIHEPITVSPRTSIGDVINLTRANRISGVPVTEGRQSLESSPAGIYGSRLGLGIQSP